MDTKIKNIEEIKNIAVKFTAAILTDTEISEEYAIKGGINTALAFYDEFDRIIAEYNKNNPKKACK